MPVDALHPHAQAGVAAARRPVLDEDAVEDLVVAGWEPEDRILEGR